MLTFISGSDAASLDAWMARTLQPPTRRQRDIERAIRSIRDGGDGALAALAPEWDCPFGDLGSLRYTREEVEEAFSVVPPEARRVLVACAANLENHHRRQLRDDWLIERPDGSFTGMRHTPVDSAGICVEAADQAAASAILMDIVPAKVAGVERIVACVPAPQGRPNPLALVAAHVAGAEEIYKLGGPLAMAALALGTESVPRVDVVAASGSQEVVAARRLLAGLAGADIYSGVPGITILADEMADPDIVAADLLSQAARGVGGCLALVTTSEAHAKAVDRSLSRLLRNMSDPREARSALRRGAAIVCEGLGECCRVSDRIAPDRLEILTREPQKLLFEVRNAGLILLGESSPLAVADYLAGLSSVLPTGGTARFSSPLGVDSFRKQTALMYFSRAEMESTIGDAILFARAEGLEQHAKGAEMRRKEADGDA